MEKEINIKRFFYVIKKRFWLVVVFAFLFSVFAGIYSLFFTKPLYESSSRVIINAEPELMNTLLVMIKEPAFLEYVIEKLNVNRNPDDLSRQVSAESIGGSSIVKISVVDTNPEMAAKIANTTAAVFKKEIPNILDFNDIRVFSKAKVSSNPINIDHQKKILIGFVVGIVAGIGIIFLLDFFNETIRSEQNAEQIEMAPVLSRVSKINTNNSTIKKKAKSKS
ncbi:YveK family protein [Neobacillus sp. LXY-4]|uniref:YveK family protein n=1 Tax=Neobacillus sp. LXY-4 TaxID=3379826 RepID=UPI003EE27644